MKIAAVRVTPIAIKDPALLHAAGVHEPFDQAYQRCRRQQIKPRF